MARSKFRRLPGHVFVGLLGVAILFVGTLKLLSGAFHAPDAGPIERKEGTPDIYFQATPQPAVEHMLRMAQLTENDIVYDLGCGDGRFVITAAQQYGARGVGVDIDPKMIEICRKNAKAAGVEHLVEFRQQDLFKTDIHEATVVSLFLLPDLNARLVPQLQTLAPGARIISYVFEIPGYPAERVEEAPSSIEGIDGNVPLHLWVTPLDKSVSTT